MRSLALCLNMSGVLRRVLGPQALTAVSTKSFGTAAALVDSHEERENSRSGAREISSNVSADAKEGFKAELNKMKPVTEDPNWWGKQKAVKWWRPDPVSGCWVPEDRFGEVNTVHERQERQRDWPRASLDERAWWSSMEELPSDRY